MRFASAAAGVRYAGRTDVTLALFDEPAAVAGVFTRSKCPSAPVDWCRAHLADGKARALVVNSGNANAFTGARRRERGRAKSPRPSRRRPARKPSEVFMASTGVIGEPLDAGRIANALDALVAGAKPDGLMDAARAIMTTDTFPKVATAARQDSASADVAINGMAKGAGMIAPDMATMLSFVFTDAPIAAPALQAMLSKRVQTLVQLHHRRQRHLDLRHADAVRDRRGREARRARRSPTPTIRGSPPFKRALDKVLLDLAHQVVRDGEGARKFVEVDVEGAARARRPSASRCRSPIRRW